ncbi:MAG TPA: hypothetical protein VJZ71_19020 [Phycisphaerae bacterium]|nr:hypothetical protein [Phycisphaerae bacterium]
MNSLRSSLAVILLISLASCAAKEGDVRTEGPDGHKAAGPQTAIARIDPQDAKPRIDSGAALLVCAYDKPEKFHKNHLQGALSLDQLQARESSLAKESEIIFYCA